MHMRARSLVLTALMLAGAAGAQTPVGDYHQHIFSAEDIALAGPDSGLQPLDAKDVIELLDAAGIRKATLLSVAFWYGKPGRRVEDEAGQVRRENDWTAAQAARYPDRLIAFCSFNPLKDYALQELKRCAATPGMGRGIKLHFGNSDVQLDDPAHVARLREVFAAANAAHMAIVVHMRASISKERPYGARQARIFVEQLLPAAPDVVVQVAHFAGSGPGYEDPPAREAMAALASSVARRDSRTRNLYFDIASIVDRDISPELAQLVADTIRQVGPGRVLYGTDAAQGANLRPRESWAAFRKLPLTDAEFAQIAANVPPYFR
ncbi:amidohydrolase family protein [Massilia sp. 2TAF26]|uniref:amidohydrolase family protein n=1 Tax=Massilia sp. 2TAF26 TaxID=3233012 RepID=UPI003F9E1E39